MFQLATELFLFLFRHWDGVCDDDLAEFALGYRLHGFTAEQAVRDESHNVLGAMLDEYISGFRESAASVGHVVD